jgi:hypothetical protein
MTNIKGRTENGEAWKNNEREGWSNYDQWVTSLWYDNDEPLYRERQEIYKHCLHKVPEVHTQTFLRSKLTRYIRKCARYAAAEEHTSVRLVQADVEELLAHLLREYQEYVEYSTK